MAETTDPTKPRRRPGRPRDANVSARVIDAALRVYAERGWEGFSLDAVTRSAKVGKPSLYRRWGSREAVLLAAFETTAVDFSTIDTGGLRNDLERAAVMLFDYWNATPGSAWMMLVLDKSIPDGLREQIVTMSRPQVASAVSMIERGISRGELPPQTDPLVILRMLTGTTQSAVTSTFSDLRRSRAAALAYLRLVTSAILSGANVEFARREVADAVRA